MAEMYILFSRPSPETYRTFERVGKRKKNATHPYNSLRSRIPSSASTTRQILTCPSLEPDASMSGLLGQKCTDHTMRLCAESAAEER